ncbi:uncharacterized protein RAG0_08513 [Rhynchosporium agropyri]|uniref:Protein kinase domain-containing protein n=1 Tax=Rhynchosporium agropyri TaxID=914238 RepID=A0A1E1KR54_9HELO|nr:uncharacterized protein RAG0_08513 [Rhynchosporium agropyri]
MAGVIPVVLQGTGGWSRAFYDRYNFWAGVNNNPYVQGAPPPRLANAVMMAEYTRTQGLAYTQELAPVPPVAIPVAAVPAALARPLGPLAKIPNADAIQDADRFLVGPMSRPRGYGPANWVAVRILGSGGEGAVVLWKYVGPAGPAPPQKKIAVKTALRSNRDLTEEGRLMGVVGASLSEHVTRLLAPPEILTPPKRLGLGLTVAWDNTTRQLIMEYCSNMTLDHLLEERIRRRMRLEEYTLWRIFECMVDACSVFEYGMELFYDPLSQQAALPASYNAALNLDTVVHKDLKPNNVFIGSRSGTHVDVPICKIGDFGLAREWPKTFAIPWQADYVGNDGQFRRGGTRGFFTPESFHPGWNYTDYQSSPVCGKFGSHTNVWQMGAIMHMLACFGANFPEANLPYVPGHNIHGAPPLGRLYGTQLRNQPGLSNLLKDAIHECLYKIPTNRASLLKLKTIIRTQIDKMVLDPAILPEHIQNIEQPEPVSEAQDGTPGFATVLKQCTALLKKPGNPQCGNSLLVRSITTRPRCWRHWDLRAFPPPA